MLLSNHDYVTILNGNIKKLNGVFGQYGKDGIEWGKPQEYTITHSQKCFRSKEHTKTNNFDLVFTVNGKEFDTVNMEDDGMFFCGNDVFMINSFVE